jgi:hypothetical protein
LRWLLNSPVGATKYEDEPLLPSEGETAEGAETDGAKMHVVPVVPEIAVVESG